VVEGPSLFQGLLLGLCLLLLPVLFLDLRIFVGRLRRAAPSPRSLGPGFAIGAALLVLLVFVQIFTNVWGYIRPISPLFRNLFWLPFAVFTALITLLVVTGGKRPAEAAAAAKVETRAPVSWGPLLALAAVFIATAAAALPGRRPAPPPGERASIRVMTFNTQQANDERGERAFHKQLELIRKVSPDVLALQETDSTRVSLNNNDYVRWYAEQLGYYSYYGPKTVGGSYGTAILSKYPLADTRTVYMYSDKDETGVAEAEIVVGGRRLAIYDVHPDSSAPAMAGFARNLIARSRDKVYAIMMGDYNLRGSDEAYAIMAGSYANAWTRVYPEGVGADGLDMRGDIRIDHIFVSAALEPRDPHYILPPASGTDHPVHWADLFWKDGP
jgi:endonuclease/exonuclease/phosphatase family metal-dependent hydrolase